ncbi:MAG: hypothetical protein JWR16_2452, partial [Nevskia sp.]|nr:hypothetical protein [Nevskia sp.]
MPERRIKSIGSAASGSLQKTAEARRDGLISSFCNKECFDLDDRAPLAADTAASPQPLNYLIVMSVNRRRFLQ